MDHLIDAAFVHPPRPRAARADGQCDEGDRVILFDPVGRGHAPRDIVARYVQTDYAAGSLLDDWPDLLQAPHLAQLDPHLAG